MKTIKITQIAKDLNVTHSAVSQWFSALTVPTIDKVIKMKELHKIPFSAWYDIKAFRSNSNNTDKEDNITRVQGQD